MRPGVDKFQVIVSLWKKIENRKKKERSLLFLSGIVGIFQSNSHNIRYWPSRFELLSCIYLYFFNHLGFLSFVWWLMICDFSMTLQSHLLLLKSLWFCFLPSDGNFNGAAVEFKGFLWIWAQVLIWGGRGYWYIQKVNHFFLFFWMIDLSVFWSLNYANHGRSTLVA